MNFLAHLYLSKGRDQVLVGNFIADFIKGRNALEQFDAEIVKGIELHRAIDDFTDRHPIVSQSKNRLRPKYRHYAAVIVDVFYDHFLATHWSTYHDTPLPAFAATAYDTLMKFDAILPDGVKRMMPYMIRGNWLVNYSRTEGIHRALTGMSRRTTFESKMDEATQDLLRSYAAFEQEFFTFFPELEAHGEHIMARLDQALE